jgi:hypothetical protein
VFKEQVKYKSLDLDLNKGLGIVNVKFLEIKPEAGIFFVLMK